MINTEVHDFVRALCPNLSPTQQVLAQQRLTVFLNFTRKIRAERAGLPPPKRIDIPFRPYQIQGGE